MRSLFCIVAIVAASACNRATPSGDAPSSTPATPEQPAAPGTARAPAPAPGSARVGAPAPDFELTDVDGKRHRLSEHKGKTVVLEWFNPDCPFVKKSHTVGSLVDAARRHTESGVVWFAINSNAAGKQGHGAERNREAKQSFKMAHPLLLDEDGAVGKAYGAKTTPHMYVIDPKGTLVYAGAIDNSPDGEGQSPTGDRLVKHVDETLAAVSAGKPVPVATTEPYGCSVKYAN